MTLKEKFRIAPMVENGLTIIEKCENITDEFAIGFADWFHENCYEDQVGYYTASELLETYKKEKGL
jgi:hypothetical protein